MYAFRGRLMTHLPVGCFERLSLVSEYFTKKDRGPLTGLGIFGNLSAAWTGSNRHLPDFISSVYIVQVVSFFIYFSSLQIWWTGLCNVCPQTVANNASISLPASLKDRAFFSVYLTDRAQLAQLLAALLMDWDR
jgi:hypothetical protein